MLGAQTRAAEYHAAKKAQARQASREAEEQRLPPPTTSISLGAFTKNTQANRNKGNKAWIPLILEQTPDAELDPGQADVIETPTKKPSDPDSDRTSTNSSPTASKPRVIMPIGQNPPTAPRAMVPGAASSIISPPHPPRSQSMPLYHHQMVPPPHFMLPMHVSFQQHQSMLQQSSYAWPLLDHPVPRWEQQDYHNYQPSAVDDDHSTPPFAHTAPLTSQHLSDSDQGRQPVQPHTPDRLRRYVFGPADLSPSKQEAKMSCRKTPSREVEEFQSQDFQGPFSRLSNAGAPIPNPIRMRDPAKDFENSPAGEGMDLKLNPAITSTDRPSMNPRFHSDASSNGSSMRATLPNPLRKYTDTDMTSEGPLTTNAWSRLTNAQCGILGDELDNGHYDRASKMQKFVAVQQVLSKQGKTVLNNPERKNTTSIAPSIIVSSSKAPESSFPEEKSRYLPPVGESCIQRASMRPPPGLIKPEHPFRPSLTTLEEQRYSMSFADIELRAAFHVGEGDWFDLKPVSVNERKRMQAAMDYVRNKDAQTTSTSLSSHQRWICHDNADPRPFLDTNHHMNTMVKTRPACPYMAVGQPKRKEQIDAHKEVIHDSGH